MIEYAYLRGKLREEFKLADRCRTRAHNKQAEQFFRGKMEAIREIWGDFDLLGFIDDKN